METERECLKPENVGLALRDAESAREALAGGVVTPTWFFSSIGLVVAVQIATVAFGVERPWIPAVGVLLFAAVAWLQVVRFRRVNGVKVVRFTSRVVFGSAPVATIAYCATLGAAIWAATAGRWWLVIIWAAIGGAGYALSGRRWMRAYRADPVAHARGESVALIALTIAAAIAALTLLVLNA